MKILYLVLDAGIPVHGPKGASGHVRAICESLADIGHDVEVVARDVGGDEGLKNDVHVVPLPSDDSAEALASVSGETRKELRDLFQNTSAYTFLVDVAKSTGPDFILERLSLFSLAGLAAARSTKTPYFLEVDAPLVEEASLYRGLTLGETARAIERAVVRGADLVFPVSTTLREWAVR